MIVLRTKEENTNKKYCERDGCNITFSEDSQTAVVAEQKFYCCFICLCLIKFGKTPEDIRHLINIENG